MFIYVPWGGVGWGNNVHVLAHSHDVTPRHVHLHVRTHVMLRWRCVTSRRGGVGWGNNVHVLAHSHDVTPRHVHLHVRTYVMLRWRCVTSRRGGVGWGGVITFTYLRTPMMLRHGTFTCTCAHTSCYVEDVDLIWTYVRTWQWRWEANVVGKALLEKTGSYLAKM